MRAVARQGFTQVAILAWVAAGLTLIGSGAVVSGRESLVGRLGRGALIAAFIDIGFMLARLRSLTRGLRSTIGADRSDRTEAQVDKRESDHRYRQILDTAKEGIMIVDADMMISMVNEQAAHMLGYSMQELLGRPVPELQRSNKRESGDAEALRTQRRFTGERETTLRRKDGSVVSVLLNESPLRDRHGRYAGQLRMLTDLTERRGLEHELAYQAAHDTLTGLPNRLLLLDRLHFALWQAQPGARQVAVVFVDVDGFREVNAAHGIRGGDQLLVEIASRLSNSVGKRDTVARFGGDEFVVVTDGADLVAAKLAEHLRSALRAPYFVGDAQIDITTSMGVAIGRYGDGAGALMRGAYMAALQAKADGSDRTEFFTEALRASSRLRLETVSDLRRAVERKEFSLYFQPIVSLDDGAIIGAEALIRWEHPRRGTLGPQEFISIAEETGLIEPIGRWVIEETCRRFARWQPLMPEMLMSLNISPRQLGADTLVENLRAAIAASGVDPSQLALEITESVLVDDAGLAAETLTALRDTGAVISIDDFGTGYSSLSRLNKFPIDILKIDRSFVAGLPESAYDTALVRAVLAIAASLDLAVIAEGVENEKQAESLLALGCRKAQGFYFYRPLTAESFEAELVASRPRPLIRTDRGARPRS